METFSEDTVRRVYEAQNGFCCVDGCYQRIVDFHHAVHNTKPNKKKYPHLLQSVFNCRGVCRDHHEEYSQYPELNIKPQVAQMYEEELNDKT